MRSTFRSSGSSRTPAQPAYRNSEVSGVAGSSNDRLRFAALASDGRVGVIDVPCTVGLRAADPLQLSDLVIGTAEQGRLVPRSRIANGSDVRMLIESMSADEARGEKSRQ